MCPQLGWVPLLLATLPLGQREGDRKTDRQSVAVSWAVLQGST